MAFRKLTFNKGANISAECLNNLQINFDRFIVEHKHDGIEAPMIDAREVLLNGADLGNPFNRSLYEHARDRSIHPSSTTETSNSFYDDSLNETDYLEIDILDNCLNWTFNGLFYETYVKLSKAYSTDYTVQVQPLHKGTYGDFFSKLNPASNFSSLEGVVPLNNTLLNINIIPVNLTPEGFTLRLYAMGKGTRHQLVAYDESAFANKNRLYIKNNGNYLISGNVDNGVFKIEYGGGFSYLPKHGKIALPVDILMNISATATKTKYELCVGDSVKPLPFNLGSTENYAFADTVNTKDAKDFVKFGPESLVTKGVSQGIIDDLLVSEKDNGKRTFYVIDSNYRRVADPITTISLRSDGRQYFVVINEDIDNFSKTIMLDLSDINVISDYVIQYKVGNGTLIPRAVDEYGNIQETNVYLTGDYEVLDDRFLLVRNATFNGRSANELFFEPPKGISINILEGDYLYNSDTEAYKGDFDVKGLLSEVDFISSGSNSYLRLDKDISIISNFASSDAKIEKNSVILAKQERNFSKKGRSIRLRPKFIMIYAKSPIFVDKMAFLTSAKSIILRKEDLIAKVEGDEKTFLMKPGFKTNINKFECYKALNRMDHALKNKADHFFTNIKLPKGDGSVVDAHAEVFNNSLINYVTNEDLDVSSLKYAKNEELIAATRGRFSTSVTLSGRMRTELLDVSGTKKRVYYIELVSQPSSTIQAGSLVHLSKPSGLINFEQNLFKDSDYGDIYVETSNSETLSNGYRVNPVSSRIGIIGEVNSVVKMDNDSYRIYLNSPYHQSTSWSGKVASLDTVLPKGYFPCDVVNIDGSPTFLYGNPKEPTLFRNVFVQAVKIADTSDKRTLSNVSDRVKNNQYSSETFSFNTKDELSANVVKYQQTAPYATDYELNFKHTLYIGNELPFNQVEFYLEKYWSAVLHSQTSYSYLSTSGVWQDLDSSLLTTTTEKNLFLKNADGGATLATTDGSTSVGSKAGVVFTRPSVGNAGNDWGGASLPGVASPKLYWIKVEFDIEDIDALSLTDRWSMYPVFRSVAVSSIHPSEIWLNEASTTITTVVSDKLIRVPFASQVVAQGYAQKMKVGDLVSWTGANSKKYTSYIQSVNVAGSGPYTLDIGVESFATTGTITDVKTRKNPVAYIRNIKFNKDYHVNILAKTNISNPISPILSSGFKDSPSYSSSRQQFNIFSEDVEPSSTTRSYIRPFRDIYAAESYDNNHVNKFYYDGEFVFTATTPYVKALTTINPPRIADIISIKERVWANLHSTDIPSAQLAYVIAKEIGSDQSYLVIYSSDSLPASDADLGDLGIGAFANKQAVIWNYNEPVTKSGDITNFPSAMSFVAKDLEMNQKIEAFVNGVASSFGGKDVVSVRFQTDDLYENYNISVSRPSFDGLMIPYDGRIKYLDTTPTIDNTNFSVNESIDVDTVFGGDKLVLPISVSSFGSILKYKTGDVQHSGIMQVMSKEMTDSNLPELSESINLLQYLSNNAALDNIADIFKNTDGTLDLLLNTVSGHYEYTQQIKAKPYETVEILFNEPSLEPDTYVKANMSDSRTDNSTFDGIKTPEIEQLKREIKSLLSSDKKLDLSFSWTEYDGKALMDYVPFKYALSTDNTVPFNLLATGLSDNSADTSLLGDGIYCLKTPLSAIKRYTPYLDGNHWGVKVNLSDSYQDLNPIFAKPSQLDDPDITVDSIISSPPRLSIVDSGDYIDLSTLTPPLTNQDFLDTIQTGLLKYLTKGPTFVGSTTSKYILEASQVDDLVVKEIYNPGQMMDNSTRYRAGTKFILKEYEANIVDARRIASPATIVLMVDGDLSFLAADDWIRIRGFANFNTGAGPLNQINGCFKIQGITSIKPNARYEVTIANKPSGGTAWTNTELNTAYGATSKIYPGKIYAAAGKFNARYFDNKPLNGQIIIARRSSGSYTSADAASSTTWQFLNGDTPSHIEPGRLIYRLDTEKFYHQQNPTFLQWHTDISTFDNSSSLNDTDVSYISIGTPNGATTKGQGGHDAAGLSWSEYSHSYLYDFVGAYVLSADEDSIVDNKNLFSLFSSMSDSDIHAQLDAWSGVFFGTTKGVPSFGLEVVPTISVTDGTSLLVNDVHKYLGFYDNEWRDVLVKDTEGGPERVPVYELASNFDKDCPYKSLIWNFAQVNGKIGIHIGNYGAVSKESAKFFVEEILPADFIWFQKDYTSAAFLTKTGWSALTSLSPYARNTPNTWSGYSVGNLVIPSSPSNYNQTNQISIAKGSDYFGSPIWDDTYGTGPKSLSNYVGKSLEVITDTRMYDPVVGQPVIFNRKSGAGISATAATLLARYTATSGTLTTRATLTSSPWTSALKVGDILTLRDYATGLETVARVTSVSAAEFNVAKISGTGLSTLFSGDAVAVAGSSSNVAASPNLKYFKLSSDQPRAGDFIWNKSEKELYHLYSYRTDVPGQGNSEGLVRLDKGPFITSGLKDKFIAVTDEDQGKKNIYYSPYLSSVTQLKDALMDSAIFVRKYANQSLTNDKGWKVDDYLNLWSEELVGLVRDVKLVPYATTPLFKKLSPIQLEPKTVEDEDSSVEDVSDSQYGEVYLVLDTVYGKEHLEKLLSFGSINKLEFSNVRASNLRSTQVEPNSYKQDIDFNSILGNDSTQGKSFALALEQRQTSHALYGKDSYEYATLTPIGGNKYTTDRYAKPMYIPCVPQYDSGNLSASHHAYSRLVVRKPKDDLHALMLLVDDITRANVVNNKTGFGLSPIKSPNEVSSTFIREHFGPGCLESPVDNITDDFLVAHVSDPAYYKNYYAGVSLGKTGSGDLLTIVKKKDNKIEILSNYIESDTIDSHILAEFNQKLNSSPVLKTDAIVKMILKGNYELLAGADSYEYVPSVTVVADVSAEDAADYSPGALIIQANAATVKEAVQKISDLGAIYNDWNVFTAPLGTVVVATDQYKQWSGSTWTNLTDPKSIFRSIVFTSPNKMSVDYLQYVLPGMALVDDAVVNYDDIYADDTHKLVKGFVKSFKILPPITSANIKFWLGEVESDTTYQHTPDVYGPNDRFIVGMTVKNVFRASAPGSPETYEDWNRTSPGQSPEPEKRAHGSRWFLPATEAFASNGDFANGVNGRITANNQIATWLQNKDHPNGYWDIQNYSDTDYIGVERYLDNAGDGGVIAKGTAAFLNAVGYIHSTGLTASFTFALQTTLPEDWWPGYFREGSIVYAAPDATTIGTYVVDDGGYRLPTGPEEDSIKVFKRVTVDADGNIVSISAKYDDESKFNKLDQPWAFDSSGAFISKYTIVDRGWTSYSPNLATGIYTLDSQNLRKNLVWSASDYEWIYENTILVDVTLEDDITLSAGTYKSAFVYRPLVTKVIEDYTRHSFYSADVDDSTIFTNNMVFDYEKRKIISTDNDKFFTRDNIGIQKDLRDVGNSNLLVKRSDLVSISLPDYDFNNPVRLNGIDYPMIAVHYKAYNPDIDPTLMTYKLYTVVNGKLQETSVEKYQLIGDGFIFFICIDATKNVFCLYDAANAIIKGGSVNLKDAPFSNAPALGIAQYAYDIGAPSVYQFQKRTATVESNKFDTLSIFNYVPEETKWAGSIGDKYLYLRSRGTKGYSSQEHPSTNDITGLFERQSSLDTVVSESGAFISSDDNLWPWGQAKGFADFDATHPLFDKYAAPYCLLVSPIGIPVNDGRSIAIPMFKYNGDNKKFDIDLMSVTTKESLPVLEIKMPAVYFETSHPYLKEFSFDATKVGTEYVGTVRNALLTDEGNILLNAVSKHTMGSGFNINPNTLNSDIQATVFLSKERIVDWNWFKDFGFESQEGSFGAYVHSIYDAINSSNLLDSRKEEVSKLVAELLKSNPIGYYRCSPSYIDLDYTDLDGVSKKVRMLSVNASGSSYDPSSLSNWNNLKELSKLRDEGLDLSPFITVMLTTTSGELMAKLSAEYENAYPSRRDGKLTDVKLVEASRKIVVDNKVVSDVRAIKNFKSTYYVKVLYTSTNDEWSSIAANDIVGFQIGPPRQWTDVSGVDTLTEPTIQQSSTRNWLPDDILGTDKWWRIRVNEQNYSGETIKSFTELDLDNWKNSDSAANLAIKSASALFDLARFERVRVKSELDKTEFVQFLDAEGHPIVDDNNQPVGETVKSIEQQSKYFWIPIAELDVAVFDNKDIVRDVSNLSTKIVISPETTVFSAFDYNKITRKFKMVLDDDHLSDAVQIDGRYTYQTYDTVEDAYVTKQAPLFNPWKYDFTTAETTALEGTYSKYKNQLLSRTGRNIFTNKAIDFLGVGPRFYNDKNWNVIKKQRLLEGVFGPLESEKSGDTSLMMPTSFGRSNTDVSVETVKFLENTGTTKAFVKDYNNVVIRNNAGVFYGFEPNAASYDIGKIDNKTIKAQTGFYYFAVQNLFDYLRIPEWVTKNIQKDNAVSLDYLEGVYLEAWTNNGWQRVPVVDAKSPKVIRLPHLKSSADTYDRLFQDVVYNEYLPLIPESISRVGPPFSRSLPPEFGNIIGSSAFYPTSSLSGYDEKWKGNSLENLELMQDRVNYWPWYNIEDDTLFNDDSQTDILDAVIVDALTEDERISFYVKAGKRLVRDMADWIEPVDFVKFAADNSTEDRPISAGSPYAFINSLSAETLDVLRTLYVDNVSKLINLSMSTPIRIPSNPATWKLGSPAFDTPVLDFEVRPIGGYWFRLLTNIGNVDISENSEEIISRNNQGTFADAKTREEIARLLFTTPVQFVNIVENKCWIEDVAIEDNTVFIVIAGENARGVIEREVHKINVSE